MVLFPATLIAIVLMPMFGSNALSTAPAWEVVTIATATPLALGLVSAFWQRRRGGTVNTAIEPGMDRPLWLFSAAVNRWLYLVALPVFIVVVVLLGMLGVVIPSRLIFAIGLGVVLLLLGVRLAEGIRARYGRVKVMSRCDILCLRKDWRQNASPLSFSLGVKLMRYEAEIKIVRTDRSQLLADVEAVGRFLEQRQALHKSAQPSPNDAVRAAERIAREGNAA